MPKNEIDYSNTIIYKITCKNPAITDVYVGHTINFVQRKHAHKQSCINNNALNHKCKVYEVIRANGGWENWHMEIINFFNCADHYAARKKEQEYFISLKATLNSIEPFPKSKVIQAIQVVEPKIKKVFESNINCSSSNILETASNNFVCAICNYICYDSSNFKKHNNTKKHKTAILEQKMNTGHVCKKCNKVYKNRNGLWYHNKKCIKEVVELYNENDINSIINENKDLKDIILNLVKSNTDLQKQMLAVCKNSDIKYI